MSAARSAFMAAGLSLCASVARAGAVIEITALTPPHCPYNGCYFPGSAVEFQVSISTDADIQIRGLTLDFHDSSPELTFVGDMNWDFSTITMDALYAKFPDFPTPNVTYTVSSPMAGFILTIPAGESLVLGTGSVVLPNDDPHSWAYYVDALHARSTDAGMSDTARLDFDFLNPTTWAANGFGDDLITPDFPDGVFVTA